jgi:hypothetical protein
MLHYHGAPVNQRGALACQYPCTDAANPLPFSPGATDPTPLKAFALLTVDTSASPAPYQSPSGPSALGTRLCVALVIVYAALCAAVRVAPCAFPALTIGCPLDTGVCVSVRSCARYACAYVLSRPCPGLGCGLASLHGLVIRLARILLISQAFSRLCLPGP